MITRMFTKTQMEEIFNGDDDNYEVEHVPYNRGKLFRFTEISSGKKYLFDSRSPDNFERLTNFGYTCVIAEEINDF